MLWSWRGLSGLHWVWRNGGGPHLQGRQGSRGCIPGSPGVLQVSSSTLACLAFPTPSHALQTALCDSASLLLPHNASSWVSPFLLWEFRPKLSLVFPGLPPSQHITIILIPSSVPSNLVGYKVFIPHDHLSYWSREVPSFWVRTPGLLLSLIE